MLHIVLLTFLLLTSAMQQDHLTIARINMVEEQIIARGVSDRLVLNAMRKVERHKFVPEVLQHLAYSDQPLPIGYDQTISQPYIVAYMTEILKLKPHHKVLEVGTGSGYQAAVLGEIAQDVYSIEIVEPLAETAKEILINLGYKNITVIHGDGYIGYAEKAPYDAIIVTAAPDHIPPDLIDQLNEGGRMIIPVGPVHAIQQLILVTKKNGKISEKKLIPVRFVPFTGEADDSRS